jgi:hypothetical protein
VRACVCACPCVRVHSHTTGIWMTNKPVGVKIKGVGHVSVIVVDTEGFHGKGCPSVEIQLTHS